MVKVAVRYVRSCGGSCEREKYRPGCLDRRVRFLVRDTTPPEKATYRLNKLGESEFRVNLNYQPFKRGVERVLTKTRNMAAMNTTINLADTHLVLSGSEYCGHESSSMQLGQL